MGFLSISCDPSDPPSPARSPPCQVHTLLLSSDPKLPLPPPPQPSCLGSPVSEAWQSVEGRRRHKGMGVLLPSCPLPGLQEQRVSLSHLWSKAPSPALPGLTPDILGSAFPWKLGGSGVHMLSLCVCITGVCLYISRYVWDAGLVHLCVCLCLSLCLWITMFKWLVGVNLGLMEPKRLCVYPCVYTRIHWPCVYLCACV